MSKWSVKLNLKPRYRKTKAKRNLQPINMLLIILQFFATGTFQSVVGNVLRYSQPSVCRSITIVSLALISKSQITFPADLHAAICDDNHHFLSVCATKPGSCRDSTIFKGNSGYCSTTILLTPYSDPIQRYERAFGVLKKHFHVLHNEIGMSPKSILVCALPMITDACCVLHNIAIDRKMPLDDLEMEERDDEVANCHPVQIAPNLFGREFCFVFFILPIIHCICTHTADKIDKNEIQILS
ncbi:hypothetical protein GHT06_014478 [Daphnia sinensis]|uniref:DDE Tnp4 domain-containing protein n=1 Tax=Daphnia sinensis TaxID=1820382 RepID=A0AAD5PW89_9CRUS|nr:hypothetical protein GHT06_014478 [Daphnia sinensis]